MSIADLVSSLAVHLESGAMDHFFTDRKCYFRVKSWPKLLVLWDTSLQRKRFLEHSANFPLKMGKCCFY